MSKAYKCDRCGVVFSEYHRLERAYPFNDDGTVDYGGEEME